MRLGDGLRIFPSLWNVRTQCRWLCAGEEPLEKPSTVWHRSQLGARQNNPPMPVVMGYACAGSDLESALIMAKSRPHFHRSDEPCPLLTRSMTSSRSSIFGVARRKRRRFALRRLLAILHQCNWWVGGIFLPTLVERVLQESPLRRLIVIKAIRIFETTVLIA